MQQLFTIQFIMILILMINETIIITLYSTNDFDEILSIFIDKNIYHIHYNLNAI